MFVVMEQQQMGEKEFGADRVWSVFILGIIRCITTTTMHVVCTLLPPLLLLLWSRNISLEKTHRENK